LIIRIGAIKALAYLQVVVKTIGLAYSLRPEIRCILAFKICTQI